MPYLFAMVGQNGQAPYTWAIVSGVLASGLSFSSAGVFSGTPTVQGADPLVIQMTDARGAVAPQVLFTLSILGAVNITTASTLPAGTQGVSYSTALTAVAGLAPYTWAQTGGTLDPGLTVQASGTINGTPTTPAAYAPVITVTDSLGATDTQAFTLSIAATGSGPNYPVTYARQLNFTSGSPTNSQSFSNTGWQQLAARNNYVAFASFGGIEQAQGQSFASIMSSMKSYVAANLPGHTLFTGLEVNAQEGFQTLAESGNTNSVETNALNSNAGNGLPTTVGWALQGSGYPSGSKVTADTGQWYANQSVSPDCPAYTINTVGTLTGPSPTFGAVSWSQFNSWWNFQGKIAGHWAAMENGSTFVSNTFAANIYCDFIDNDNWFMTPRADGCWQSNPVVFHPTSSSADSNTIAPTLQRGLAAGATMYRALQPGIKCVTNMDYFVFVGSGTHPQLLDPSNQHFWDAVLAEVPIGVSSSYVTRAGSFASFLTGLATQEQAVKATGNVVWLMEASGAPLFTLWGGNQQTSFAQADWQSADYQIGIAALMRWYVGIQPQSGNNVFWFDSWNAGTLNRLHWWGQPVGSRSFTPNAQGIYVIPWSGGTFYLYPAGANDLITTASYSGYPGGLTGAPVTLASSALVGGGGHHLTYNGFSDSTVNTGAAFSTLTLQPRSCVFTLP